MSNTALLFGQYQVFMCHHKDILAAGDKPVSHKLKYENMFILPPFKIIWKHWTCLFMRF